MNVVKFLVCAALAGTAVGCGTSNERASANSNVAAAPERAEKLQPTAVHTTEGNQPPIPVPTPPADGSHTKWTQGGNPIDTAEFDAAIEQANAVLKSNPQEAKAKTAAAQAYFERGFALTEARQYAAALGDYRKALKLDPSHEESQKWIKQIVGIYEMMKKDYPPDGEEPPALPFKKESQPK